MKFPKDLKYTKDHEWVRVEGDTGYVGITDFAQGELGDIVFVDITESGVVEAGASFGSVEAVKTVSELYMPITADIEEVNEEIGGKPELLNKDPYGKGWIIKVKLTADSDLSTLLDADAYKAHIGH